MRSWSSRTAASCVMNRPSRTEAQTSSAAPARPTANPTARTACPARRDKEGAPPRPAHHPAAHPWRRPAMIRRILLPAILLLAAAAAPGAAAGVVLVQDGQPRCAVHVAADVMAADKATDG